MRGRLLAVLGAGLLGTLGCASDAPPRIQVDAEARGVTTSRLMASEPEPHGTDSTPLLRYCRVKYGADPKVLGACAQEEFAAFERLLPALDRAASDPLTAEAKTLESCRRHNEGRLGIDWMMVEHCFSKRSTWAAPGAFGE